MVYTHGWDIVPDGWSAALLQVPLIDTQVYNSDGVGERHGKLVWLHRYLEKGGVPGEVVADATEISFRGKVRSPRELAALYRSAELFYTYEHSTGCFEALLCGCPVVYLPNPLMLDKPLHSYLGDDGVAWGDSPEAIAHAKATVHKARERYEAIHQEFLQELRDFIDTTQGRVRAKSYSNVAVQLAIGKSGRTERQLPKLSVATATDTLPAQRLRLGVLSGDFLDGACMRLRLHDAFSLLSPWIDTAYFPGNSAVGCRREEFDIDTLVEWADVFIIQRGILSERNSSFLDKCFASGKTMIFEADDWLPGMPASHRQFYEFDPYGLLRFWRDKMHLFAAVTASTEPLAVRLRELNQNVHLIPNALSATRYAGLKREPKGPDAPITIGFAGTSTHADDMKVIGQALLNIQQKYAHLVQFVFWGCSLSGLEGAANVKVVGKSVTYIEYLQELNRLEIDIGIAPLEDTVFNESKSDLKWLEYTAIGAACVLSDVPAYREAKELGLAEVVGNDTASWDAALSRLVEDAERRHQLHTASRDYLLRYATLESQAYRWVELLREVLPTPFLDTLASYHPERQAVVENNRLQLMWPNTYRAWQSWDKQHQLREIDAEMMAERMLMQWQQQPQFLLLMPIRASEAALLANTIDALQQQLYKHWKLIVVADWEMPDPIFNQNDTLGWLQLDSLDDPQLFSMALNGLLGKSRQTGCCCRPGP
jgi:glycosyltransferase involved in cell wall biosynthesis